MKSFLSTYDQLTKTPRNLNENNEQYIGLIARLVSHLQRALEYDTDIDMSIKRPFMEAMHLFTQQVSTAEMRNLRMRLDRPREEPKVPMGTLGSYPSSNRTNIGVRLSPHDH